MRRLTYPLRFTARVLAGGAVLAFAVIIIGVFTFCDWLLDERPSEA